MNGRAIVLDASLLVLFVVGSTRRDLVGRHKRLKAFAVEDFELLEGLVSLAQRVIVTPNTLTEASNLLAQIDHPIRTELRETFRRVIGATEEQYVPSLVAASTAHFPRLGLTDAGLLEVLSGMRSLLTTDLDLYLAALRVGAEAVNFNHLRFGQV